MQKIINITMLPLFRAKITRQCIFFGPGRSTFRWLAGFSECNIFGLGMQFFAMQEKTMHGSPSTTFDGEITGGKIDFFSERGVRGARLNYANFCNILLPAASTSKLQNCTATIATGECKVSPCETTFWR